MSGYLHLVLSMYVVFLIYDIAISYNDYENYNFKRIVKDPTQSWLKFFFAEHIWSVGTVIAFGLLGLMLL